MGVAHGAGRRRWSRVVVLGMVTAAATLAGAVPGRAASNYTMVIVPNQVVPGELFTVRNADGSECPPGAEVWGSLDLPVSGWMTTADANGDWSKQLYIYENIGHDVYGNPIPTPPGEYHVFATCAVVGPEASATTSIVYDEAVVTLLPPPAPGWGLDFDEAAARAAIAAASSRIDAAIRTYGRPNE